MKSFTKRKVIFLFLIKKKKLVILWSVRLQQRFHTFFTEKYEIIDSKSIDRFSNGMKKPEAFMNPLCFLAVAIDISNNIKG